MNFAFGLLLLSAVALLSLFPRTEAAGAANAGGANAGAGKRFQSRGCLGIVLRAHSTEATIRVLNSWLHTGFDNVLFCFDVVALVYGGQAALDAKTLEKAVDEAYAGMVSARFTIVEASKEGSSEAKGPISLSPADAEAVSTLCGDVPGREVVIVADDTVPLCENGLYHVGYAVQKALTGSITSGFDALVMGTNIFAVRCRGASGSAPGHRAVLSMVNRAREGATAEEAPWIKDRAAGDPVVAEASPRLAVYRYHLSGQPGERVASGTGPAATARRCFDVNTDGGFHEHCHHEDLAPCHPRQTRQWSISIDDSYREYFEGHEINHPMLVSPYMMSTHRPPDFPDLSNVEVVTSRPGDNCATACRDASRACSQEALYTLNTCTALSAYVDCKGCLLKRGSPLGLPGVIEATGTCMLSQLRDAVSCDAKAGGVRRLCTCFRKKGSRRQHKHIVREKVEREIKAGNGGPGGILGKLGGSKTARVADSSPEEQQT